MIETMSRFINNTDIHLLLIVLYVFIEITQNNNIQKFVNLLVCLVIF